MAFTPIFILILLILQGTYSMEITCRRDPTPQPSTDPTVIPTPLPTPLVTDSSSDDRRRRLLSVSDGTEAGRKCIRLKMEIELENILPTNNKPEGCTNIELIAKSTANTIGSGIVNNPHCDVDAQNNNQTTTTATPSPLDETVWEVPPECHDPNQVKDEFFPEGTTESALSGQATVDGDIISVTFPLITEESIIYIFKLSQVILSIGTDCSVDWTMNAVIYLNNVAVTPT
eukprot:326520_1